MKPSFNQLIAASMLCLLTGQVFANNSSASKEELQALGLSTSPAFGATNEQLKKVKPTIGFDQLYSMSKRKELTRANIGGMDGGGGKILLTKNGTSIQAVVLDIYEAQNRKLTIDMGPGKSAREKLDYVLERLEKVAPLRAYAYYEWINDFFTRSSELGKDVLLPITEDLGSTLLPKDSELIQVIVQRSSQETQLGLARYLIDANVFAQLDAENQAALVLHEVVYREARSRGETNSLLSRYLTGVILSKEVGKLTAKQFNAIVAKVGSDCTENEYYPESPTCTIFPVRANGINFFGEGLWGYRVGSSTNYILGFNKDYLELQNMISEALGTEFKHRFVVTPLQEGSPIEIKLNREIRGDQINYLSAQIANVNFRIYIDMDNMLNAICSLTANFTKEEVILTCTQTHQRAGLYRLGESIDWTVANGSKIDVLKIDKPIVLKVTKNKIKRLK